MRLVHVMLVTLSFLISNSVVFACGLLRLEDLIVTCGTGDSYFVNCTRPHVPNDGIKFVCHQKIGVPDIDLDNACSGSYSWRLENIGTCSSGVTPAPTNKVTPNKQCAKEGSIIFPESMIFTELVPVLGVPFALVYSSDKVIGRKDYFKIRAPLISSSAQFPSSFLGRKLTISIGERIVENLYSPSLDLVTNFTWDGLNHLGMPLTGVQLANVSLVNSHNSSCSVIGVLGLQAGEWLKVSSGSNKQTSAETSSINNFNNCVFEIPRTFQLPIGSPFSQNDLIGGWNFNIRHHYDSIRKVLHLGDGRQLNVGYKTKPNGDHWVVSEDRSQIFVFNQSFKHSSTLEALTGRVELSFQYDSSGRLIKVKDMYANETVISYSGSLPVSITSPYGQVTTLDTDVNGYLTSVTSPSNEPPYEMTYTQEGLLLTFKKPNNVTSTMSYDSEGNLISDISSAGPAIYLSKTFNPIEGETDIFQINSTSNLGRIHNMRISVAGNNYSTIGTYPNFKTVNTTENLIEKNSSVTIGSYSVSTNHTVDTRLGVERVSNQYISDKGQYLALSFNESALITDPDDPFSFQDFTKTITHGQRNWISNFNTMQRLLEISSPLQRKNKVFYNINGEMSSYQTIPFLPVSFSYDTRGRVTQILNGTRTVNFQYNLSNGLISSVENSLNQVTSYSYDSSNRVNEITLPDSRKVSFVYDVMGNVIKVTPPGKPFHEMTYNGMGYLDGFHPPLLANTTNVSTTYTYSDDRELTGITRPNGQTATYSYNVQTGDLETLTIPNGVRTYYWSQGDLAQSFSEDNINRSLSFSGTALYYDVVNYGYFSATIYNVFNSSLLQASESLQAGLSNWDITFSYDDDNLLVSSGNLSYIRSPSSGLITDSSLGVVEQTYGYSADYGELSGITSSANNNQIYQETMTRDSLGRITSKTEKYGPGPTKNFAFEFDSAGRLTEVKVNNVVHSTFSYDSNSNRTSQTINGSTISGITYDDQDRLLQFGTKTFTYTLNGDVSSVTDSSNNTVRTYSYDVFGNLKEAILPGKTVSYSVDAHDRRMIKKENGIAVEYYVWNSNNQLIGIMNANGELLSRFIYGSKTHVPDYMSKNNIDYQIVTNHLGSPVAVVDSSTGVVEQEIVYDVWGNILSDTNPGFTPFGFAGCLYDQDTKLCRFGARDYDASIGRWLSKDPILFAGGDTNLYGYVMQDPINWIDPNGMTAQDVQDATNYIAAQYGVTPASYGFGTPSGSLGMAIPFANHMQVASKYQGALSDAQKQNLLMTIRHEYQHIFDGTLKTIFNSQQAHDKINLDSFNYSLKNINSFLDYQRKTSCPSK